MFRFVFWDVLPCKIIVDRRFRGTGCLHLQALMMEAARISETSVDNYFTLQYKSEDKSELHVYIYLNINVLLSRSVRNLQSGTRM
jgi:hypothetical protein